MSDLSNGPIPRLRRVLPREAGKSGRAMSDSGDGPIPGCAGYFPATRGRVIYPARRALVTAISRAIASSSAVSSVRSRTTTRPFTTTV